MKIYKYRLVGLRNGMPLPLGNFNNEIVVETHQLQKILRVDVQNDVIYLWALVDENAPIQQNHFTIHATGDSVYTPAYYHIGTVFADIYVWHIFKRA